MRPHSFFFFAIFLCELSFAHIFPTSEDDDLRVRLCQESSQDGKQTPSWGDGIIVSGKYRDWFFYTGNLSMQLQYDGRLLYFPPNENAVGIEVGTTQFQNQENPHNSCQKDSQTDHCRICRNYKVIPNLPSTIRFSHKMGCFWHLGLMGGTCVSPPLPDFYRNYQLYLELQIDQEVIKGYCHGNTRADYERTGSLKDYCFNHGHVSHTPKEAFAAMW